MGKLRVSLAQIDIALGNVEENWRRATACIIEAAARGSELVVLPELFTTGYDLQHWSQYATSRDRGDFARLANLARTHNIAIAGSMLEADAERCYNTLAWVNASGEISAAYRKAHLFRLMDEHRWLAPGNQTTLVQTPAGPVGLGICYDLRFCEFFRRYALEGACLAVVVAQWPARRVSHWRTLLRARAIENQMFVLGVNRCGKSGDELFGGASALIDPWGEVVCEAENTPTLLHAEIDLARVSEIRAQIPVFSDRRADIYGDCRPALS